MDILGTRDSKGKIRIVEIECKWNDVEHAYVITRNTYQYGGKVTAQPELYIRKGKAKRTVSEQAKLEYNSHLKKYQDKGYKIIPKDINNKEQLEEFIPMVKEDSNGFKKHMLAKQASQVATSTFDKIPYWWASRKIDGIRASFELKDEEVHTASRGGDDYDISTRFIRTNPKLVEFFNLHPDYILDGELYKHGKSLQQISGAARLEKDTGGMDWLEFYLFDVMIPDMKFEDRLDIIHQIQEELNLSFDPNREWKEGELRIQVVPHEKVTGWANIKKLHDKYVSEGWEGLVIRDPNKCYKFGGRGSEMIKIKEYNDAEFKIVGYSEGLRPEDMVFICETADGLKFEAKPMGSRELKYEYIDNMDNIIGRMATVKYFYLSDSGVPLQPVLKCIRDYD